MDNELIKKARRANLAEHLMSLGIPLIRNGNRYRHKEHDSLIFTGNAYYWNSRQEHGNAIDYLVRHMGMDFVSAVLTLVPENERISALPSSSTKKFDISKMPLAQNCDRALKYLHQIRQIGTDILNELVRKKLLLQQKTTNNIVFPIYDENNKCVGAELHGTTDKRFKGVGGGGKYGYGFNIKHSDDNTFDYVLFFESAVDLISFMEYKMKFESKPLKRCVLVSMSGLKMNVLKHNLKIFDGAKAVLCVDNDSAGQTFKNEAKAAKINYIDCSPREQYKDWNEQLKDARKRDKPIQRLLNRGLSVKHELNRII